jgi:hypothetical protein
MPSAGEDPQEVVLEEEEEEEDDADEAEGEAEDEQSGGSGVRTFHKQAHRALSSVLGPPRAPPSLGP